MITITKYPNIHLDLFLNNVYQTTINEFQELDVRRQIAKQKLSGYTLKINPQYHGFFKSENKIEDYVVEIDKDGNSLTWFPTYYLNETYPELEVFSEVATARFLLLTEKNRK